MGNELMNLKEESREMEKVDPGAVAAAESAKARIQSAFIMAFKNPRNVDEARARILESCKRTEFAKTVEYSKPMGNIKIRGRSIRFAEEAARAWKNILTSTYVVHEDDERRRITIIVTDLEANLNHSQEIIVMKTVERKKPGEDREVLGERINSQGDKVFIVRATDEEVQSKENNQISKILRNEILRMIPSDIQEEALAMAKQTLAEHDKKDPGAAKKNILDNFQSIGIWPKDIEAYLKHKIDNLSPKELEDLREAFAAIKSGESTWRDFMEQAREEGASSEAGIPSNKTAELTDAEKAEIKRFDDAVASAKDVPRDIFQKFVEESAHRLNKSVGALKIMALADWANFWTGFNRYLKKQKEAAKENNPPAATTETKAGEKKDPPADKGGEGTLKTTQPTNQTNGKKGPNGGRMIDCPERPNTQMEEKFCRTQCWTAEECKAYQELIAKKK